MALPSVNVVTGHAPYAHLHEQRDSVHQGCSAIGNAALRGHTRDRRSTKRACRRCQGQKVTPSALVLALQGHVRSQLTRSWRQQGAASSCRQRSSVACKVPLQHFPLPLLRHVPAAAEPAAAPPVDHTARHSCTASPEGCSSFTASPALRAMGQPAVQVEVVWRRAPSPQLLFRPACLMTTKCLRCWDASR